jgi:hypothetical protein
MKCRVNSNRNMSNSRGQHDELLGRLHKKLGKAQGEVIKIIAEI